MTSSVYRFGPFRLYPSEQLLLREQQPIPLAPKAFDLLVVLTGSNGRLMKREELMQAVWPDSFVEEINLTVNISQLRKLLGSMPDGNAYIVTVPKRGYRFNAPVTEQSEGPGATSLRETPRMSESASASSGSSAAIADASPLRSLVSTPPNPEPPAVSVAAELPVSRSYALARWSRSWGMALLLLLLLASLAWLGWARYRSLGSGNGNSATASPAAIHSLAILPFEFIGEDSNLAYLGLGMTDALVTRLSGQSKVVVRPIGAVRRYSDVTDVGKAGRDLQVDAVLDGTVQRLTGQTRVTVRLLRVASGEVIWTDSFDEGSGTAFELEDAISQRLAQALTLQLTGEERRRLAAPRTRSVEAYDLYTRGRVLWNNRSVESVRKSLDLFEQAIQADPKYAAAYAGLADAYILAGTYGNSFLAPAVAAPKAEEAVQRALALDEESAEAHTSLAYLRLTYDWDWAGAEREFRRALVLDPAYFNAHHWYSHELLALGRVAESHQQSEEALTLDPTDIIANEHMAWHHLFAREYDASITQALKAVEIDPNFVQAHRVLGLAYLYKGQSARACPEFQTGVRLSHEDPVALAYLARCYAVTHREAEARQIVAQLENASKERYISAAEIGAVHAALGDPKAAVHWLEQACDEHASALIYLNVDPVFDAMRGDLGFQAVVSRIHLLPKQAGGAAVSSKAPAAFSY